MTATLLSAALPAEPGTYVLVMRLDRRATVRIGGLGAKRLRPGFYTYAGSALGSGGIAARVGRHVHASKVIHWHVDYLRRVAPLREVWFRTGGKRCEHEWARALATLPGASAPIRGFGASDCRCPSHLVYFTAPPAIAAFRQEVCAATRPIGPTPHRWDEFIERVTFA